MITVARTKDFSQGAQVDGISLRLQHAFREWGTILPTTSAPGRLDMSGENLRWINGVLPCLSGEGADER